MTIGLDIGGRSIRSLRRESRRLIGRTTAAEYIALPPTDNDRRLLERARVPYASCEGSLIVHGRSASELAPVVHVPRLPVLPQGQLPHDDPLARQLAASLLEALLPQVASGNAVCVVAPPLPGANGDVTGTREWDFFSRVIRMRGYQPVAIDRPSALVLAELGHAGFTGVALTFEDFRCAAVIARCGQALVQAGIPRGLAWIDEVLARAAGYVVWDMDGNSYVDFDTVLRWKQTASPSLVAPDSPEADTLARCYQSLLHELVRELAARSLDSRDVATLRGPLPLACCGEATLARGFVQLLADELNRTGLPIGVGDIRIADDPVFTVARGCLIRAELEGATPIQQGAA
jgi:hypothetical protein